MALSYYVLFHKNLPYNTQVFTEEEQKCFQYVAINESVPKDIPEWAKAQTLCEWEIKYYNPLYHMNNMSYASLFFQLARNPDVIKTPYIGFGQYDQHIDPEYFREVLLLFDTNPTVLCGAFRLSGKQCCEYFTHQGWDILMIQRLNQLHPSIPPIQLVDLEKKGILGMNTFILPKTVFLEMMDFVEIHVLKNLMIMLKYDTSRISSCLERAFGIYLAYCIHKETFTKLVTYKVRYDEEQRIPDVSQPNPIVQNWIEEIDHTMPIKQAKKWIAPILPLLDDALTAKGKKVWFMTFGLKEYEKVLERIQKEATQSGFFDKVKIYQPSDLSHSEFWLEHKEYAKKPNYGNWLWKPYLVLETLERMNYDDVLVYVDMASIISPSGYERFKNYLQFIRQSSFGMLVFQSNRLEKTASKMDVVHQTKMRHPRITDTPQYNSKTFLIRKCDYIMKFVKEWCELASKNYSWLEDTPSVIANDPSFQSHHAEHALFSILAKRHGAETLPDETTPIRPGYPILYHG